MKIYTIEYGSVRVSFLTWILHKILCREDRRHKWNYLGDPCYCGSDNCYRAPCGLETHD